MAITTSHKLSVIVPENPFTKEGEKFTHCLCAMDVEKLMLWWPGDPHNPNRDAQKVTSIQRSLDWKRVAQIAAYLLQKEIHDAPDKLAKYFGDIYEPKKNEPGRSWPPKIPRVINFEKSSFRTFSNVLIHVNGATIETLTVGQSNEQGAAKLVFKEKDPKLNFSVIDGQHRINGAYFAIRILKEKDPKAKWEIPADIFLDLDPLGGPPIKQAQIFIDVNFYQKKVDRSLVADLFPTARGTRDSLDDRERAQDIGRKLMLETGPLVGMIQIPGIRYGVKEVITLSTLNGAIENIIEILEEHTIVGLEMQTQFLVQVLSAWSDASGKFEQKKKKSNDEIDPNIVAYQGRVLVSVLTLVPAMIWKLKTKKVKELVSDKASDVLAAMLTQIATQAGLLTAKGFITKEEFKKKKYLGAGGIGRFRDTLWAALDSPKKLTRTTDAKLAQMAEANRAKVAKALNKN